MTFPAKLRELREAAGLSQLALAEEAEVSLAGVAQLEQGRRKPTWEMVQKLAAALGVGVDVFAEPPASNKTPTRGRPKKKEK